MLESSSIRIFGIKPSKCCESAVQLQVLKSLTAGCCLIHNASTALPAKTQKPAILQVSADLCHSGGVDLNFDLTCLDPQKLISLDSLRSLTMPILNSKSSFDWPIGLLDLVLLLLANIHPKPLTSTLVSRDWASLRMQQLLLSP